MYLEMRHFRFAYLKVSWKMPVKWLQQGTAGCSTDRAHGSIVAGMIGLRLLVRWPERLPKTSSSNGRSRVKGGQHTLQF